MESGYKITESFADPMRIPKNLLESAGRSANNERMSLVAFIAWLHFTVSGKEALKVASNCTH